MAGRHAKPQLSIAEHRNDRQDPGSQEMFAAPVRVSPPMSWIHSEGHGVSHGSFGNANGDEAPPEKDSDTAAVYFSSPQESPNS